MENWVCFWNFCCFYKISCVNNFDNSKQRRKQRCRFDKSGLAKKVFLYICSNNFEKIIFIYSQSWPIYRVNEAGLHKKWSFPLRISSVTVTEEIINGKLPFYYSGGSWEFSEFYRALIQELRDYHMLLWNIKYRSHLKIF